MIVNEQSLSACKRSFQIIFNQALGLAKSLWPLVAMPIPSSSSEQGYPWLGDFPTMREWIGDRVIKDLIAHEFVIKNKSFESTVGVLKTSIEDDTLGIYTPRFQMLGQTAAEHPDVLVFSLLKAAFTTLCYDGQYFVDTDHPWGGGFVSNHGGGAGTPWFLMDLSRPIKPLILQIRKKPEFVALDKPDSEEAFKRGTFIYGVDDRKNVGMGLWQLVYGSKQTLNADNFAAAMAAMESLKRDDGNGDGTSLNIQATHLVYPPTLDSAARTLLKAQNKAGGESNIWFETVTPVKVPWLA